jgi:hypothetical protein
MTRHIRVLEEMARCIFQWQEASHLLLLYSHSHLPPSYSAPTYPPPILFSSASLLLCSRLLCSHLPPSYSVLTYSALTAPPPTLFSLPPRLLCSHRPPPTLFSPAPAVCGVSTILMLGRIVQAAATPAAIDTRSHCEEKGPHADVYPHANQVYLCRAEHLQCSGIGQESIR